MRLKVSTGQNLNFLGIQVGFFNPSTIQQVVKKKKKKKKRSLSGLTQCSSPFGYKKEGKKKCLLLCINVKVLFLLSYILFMVNYFNA
jgi:hypothetical protein